MRVFSFVVVVVEGVKYMYPNFVCVVFYFVFVGALKFLFSVTQSNNQSISQSLFIPHIDAILE